MDKPQVRDTQCNLLPIHPLEVVLRIWGREAEEGFEICQEVAISQRRGKDCVGRVGVEGVRSS